MSSHRHLRRTDLFLVRVWTENTQDGSDKTEWGGRVQRVVDGEAHQFSDWQGLVNILSAMLSGVKGEQSSINGPT